MSWNKGLTKETSDVLRVQGEKHAIFMKELFKTRSPWNKGISVRLNPQGEFKKGHIAWHAGKKWLNKKKETHCKRGHMYQDNWVHAQGWRICKQCQNDLRKKRRHDTGVNKIYRTKPYSVRRSKEEGRLYRKQQTAILRGGGDLPMERLQMVYEDNIKKYGTLTCYLCELSISFGEDALEHKTPISRGGTNEYYNLGIAHRKCNNKKYNMTEEEYRFTKES